MKNVTITFIGNESDKVAQIFYTWIIDEGLEDVIIKKLSGEGINVVGVKDCNNDHLNIAIETEELKIDKEMSLNENHNRGGRR